MRRLSKRRLGKQKIAGLMGSRVVLDSGQEEGFDSLEMAAVVATTSGPSLKCLLVVESSLR